jgi:hypothetical protein
MAQQIDPAVPPNVVKQIMGPDGIHPSQWSEDPRDPCIYLNRDVSKR